MLATIARIILRHRLLTLFSLLVMTGVMAYFASQVQISYEGAKILPPTDPTYAEYLKFKEKFGEDGTVMVIGFQSDKIWDHKIFSE